MATTTNYPQYNRTKPCKVEVILDLHGWSRIEFLAQYQWDTVVRGAPWRMALDRPLETTAVCYDVQAFESVYRVADFYFEGRYVDGRPVLVHA